MPRKSPGGVRQGNPNKTYTNRADLNSNKQPIAAAPNQPYGARGAQEAAQSTIPLPQQGPAPGSFGQLGRPTERPNEPVTAGVPTGPGPNQLNNQSELAPMLRTPLIVAKALMSRVPSPEIARIIRYLEGKFDGPNT